MSCNEDSLTPQYVEPKDNISTVCSKINEDEAISIANKVLGRSSISRQSSVESPRFNYVLSSQTKNSRSNSQDTLAYAINYPNDNGLVIVSTTKTIYPVIAFSNEGNTSENITVYAIDGKILKYIPNPGTCETITFVNHGTHIINNGNTIRKIMIR